VFENISPSMHPEDKFKQLLLHSNFLWVIVVVSHCKRNLSHPIGSLHFTKTFPHMSITVPPVTYMMYLCKRVHVLDILMDEVLLTVSCPIFHSILIAKNLLTGSLKNRSIDNLETQKKSISMKNSQFFDYLHYAKSK
jgi:hypothetical protein